jgi:hypothetical protein
LALPLSAREDCMCRRLFYDSTTMPPSGPSMGRMPPAINSHRPFVASRRLPARSVCWRLAQALDRMYSMCCEMSGYVHRVSSAYLRSSS